MHWDPVQTSLRNAGHLIYAVSQAQSEVLNTPGPWGSAYDGYCIGMAARWIQLRSWDSDFEFNPATLECDGLDWRATVLQNVSDASGSADDVGFWNATAHAHGMRLNQGIRLAAGHEPSGAFLTHLMARGPGWFGITLRSTTGAHAIASEHGTDGSYRLFDANYGHIRSPDANAFEALMDWYFAFTGYDTRYKAGSIIIGVDP